MDAKITGTPPHIVAGYFIVGLIWGTTNAFMEQGSKKKEDEKSDNALKETGSLFSNIKFIVPLVVNQLGSILNNFVVAASDLSIAVPAVNCITFIITFLTQKWLKGEKISDWKFFIGSGLIMVGMYFCINK